ncbi:MAG: hypothetical protein ACM31P_07065 [Actinomycetota bacterium]
MTNTFATTIMTTRHTPSSFALPAGFPAVLDEGQLREISDRIAAIDFATMDSRDIALLGAEAEQALHRVLDGFLGRIEKADQPRLFKLFTELKEAVDRENLPAVAARILDAKPSLLERLVGAFSRKALRQATSRAYDEACRVATGKSRKLSDLVGTMERELQVEQQRLSEELCQLETLKETYRERFTDFAQAAAFAHGLLEKARQEVAGVDSADGFATAELQDKLQALESRALALEGTLSRLPSDQLVIRQLQNAGIATLQELATTASARFSSIKMTLLTIHGARITQDVQRLAQQGADLDRNLAAVRGMLLEEVVSVAAHAPGDNRLAQAEQLRQIVEETKTLQLLVADARVCNQQKFDAARQMFAQARQDMVSLGRSLNPAKPISL